MAKVTINRKEDLEKVLKQFKRRCVREGIFRECRERRHYVKPSLKRRKSIKSPKKKY